MRDLFALFLLALILFIPFAIGSALYSIGGWWIFGAIAIGYVVYRHVKHERERAQEELRLQQERERAEAEARANYQAYQAMLRNDLDETRRETVQAYSQIPVLLLKAEEQLLSAEREYNDRAFSPFWQAIEAVLKTLADVNSNIERLTYLASRHAKLSKDYDGPIEPFPVEAQSVNRVHLAKETENRMGCTIRQAQRDFQFATIYEQRRTTSVLICGFATLGQAIDGLGYRLSSSMETLSDQVRNLEHGMRERQSEVLSSLGQVVDGVQTAADQAAVQRERLNEAQLEMANKQLAMLDNIQRRREPLNSERGSRIF
ncbi:MAG TPA: hypothetical protein VF662_05195 [Allosphingosinicella sp.]|jgi:hypothetical protein